ncbi:hypothetical protein KAS14_05175 [Candidatus Bathyarchaeota archaeon]|nr:hypothetical protein [Candidatus Bathyarchaeota archaeon]
MKDMLLKSILDNIQKELKKRDKVRVESQSDMRRVLSLSKQAILFVHQERFNDATKFLEDAGKLFAKLLGLAKDHQDLLYSGLVDAASQEYSEACVLLGLVIEGQFISPEKLGVSASSYILGLADVIGELRRRALDSLRKGDIETAEDSLRIMEQIFIELTAMDDAYMLVKGLRRKCDIARRIIETTRGDVTIEVRRSSLENSIKRLEETLEKGEEKIT